MNDELELIGYLFENINSEIENEGITWQSVLKLSGKLKEKAEVMEIGERRRKELSELV